MPERLEVQRPVAASAAEIFAVLTDPRGHVAIDSSGMLMEASGDIVAKVGDTFVVHMDREALRHGVAEQVENRAVLVHRRGELPVALGGFWPGDTDLHPDSREAGANAVVEPEEAADVEERA